MSAEARELEKLAAAEGVHDGVDLPNRIALELRRIARVIDKACDMNEVADGLTLLEQDVLLSVMQYGHLPSVLMSPMMSVARGGRASLIARLAEMSLVKRTRSLRDRRHVNLHLTPYGRDVTEALRSRREQVFAEMFKGHSEEDQTLFLILLRQFRDAMPGAPTRDVSLF